MSWIADRIKCEYEKYHKKLPDEWFKIAEAKIISQLKSLEKTEDEK